ncbi:unnamed protein product [marine sediment metagenome]|uniref:Uncharacterized protein n=1 Tax=marine sediment metagenome TaxID=412755 RepID=X0V1I1_9ZZZZ
MSKWLVEDCKILDIKALKDRGCFSRGRENITHYIHWHNSQTGDYCGCIQIAVEFSKINKNGIYTITDNPCLNPYKGHLTSTHCNYGGQRYWFICPLSGCNRRVAKLYKPNNGRYFGCRHCYNLAYASMNVSRTQLDKALAKMFRKYG